jgi:PAS domain S-box-containing protein
MSPGVDNLRMISDLPAFDPRACAQEPIQIPGAIQPHGALLVASRDGSVITHASANLAKFLGVDPSSVLGRPLEQALGAEAVRALIGRGLHDASQSSRLHVLASSGGRMLQLRSHGSQHRLCIDIETTSTEPWQRPYFTLAQSVLESFKAAHNRLELCELAVRGLRSVLGYDRVMAYRFGEDGHGEVIAESRGEHVVPYLGQHYPASNIPAQARALYLRQRVGVIVDAAYAPVPLLAAAADDGVPVDLTHSSLRSVSPMHRAFMLDMQTAASLTVALVSGNEAAGLRLWGMLVCHHSTPREPGPELRAIADTIGQVVSVLLDGHGAAELYAERTARNETLRLLVSRLGDDAPLLDTLAALGSELLRLADATGALVRVDGALLSLGNGPEPALGERVMALLSRPGSRELVAVDDLGLRHPELADAAQVASGALLLPLDDDGADAILWFRPEKMRTLVWGRDPAEPANPDSVTGSISPPKSLEAWKQVVRGRAESWTAADVALATELGRSIDSEIARRTEHARDLFDRIFESSPSGLLLLGPHGLIKMVNKQACEIFGYRREELLGQPLELLMPERGRAAHVGHRVQFHAKPVLRRMGQERGLLAMRKDGSEFQVEITLNPLDPNALGGVPMIQASITDITSRLADQRDKRLAQERMETVGRQARLALEDLNAKLTFTNNELDQFVYTASHDLRSPLRAISSLVQFVLEDDHALCAETQSRMLLIAGRARRMQNLLDDVLAYARAGKGGGPLGPLVNAGELVDDIVATLMVPAGFEIERDESVAAALVHAVPLNQVLHNVIANAIKHHDKPSGRVRVAALDEGAHWRFSVTDDGPGIAAAYRQAVFKMFTTLKRRDEVEASGIGLALVHKLVTLQGGKCGVESAPDRGACIWFEWPKASRQAERTA